MRIDVYEKLFHKTLFDLKDVWDKIIVVGGWCPMLYARYLWNIPLKGVPRTTDIDLGVIETGTKRYDPTVYERMVKLGYLAEPFCGDEPEPVEFVCEEGPVKMKVEFLTSCEVSDDTLRCFLGPQIACHRIEGFEVLLRGKTVDFKIPSHDKKMPTVRALAPSTYLFHKGVTFTGRGDKGKRDKDILYMYYVLLSCPDPRELIREVLSYRDNKYFEIFRGNMKSYFENKTSPGFRAIRKLSALEKTPKEINEDIMRVFEPILKVL